MCRQLCSYIPSQQSSDSNITFPFYMYTHTEMVTAMKVFKMIETSCHCLSNILITVSVSHYQ